MKADQANVRAVDVHDRAGDVVGTKDAPRCDQPATGR
jgi:hypothetical protein